MYIIDYRDWCLTPRSSQARLKPRPKLHIPYSFFPFDPQKRVFSFAYTLGGRNHER